MKDLLVAIWFLVPAAAANAAPIFSRFIPVWNRWQTPLDGGLTFHGRELLGRHKTWRGIVSGVLAATTVLWLQQLAYGHSELVRSVSGGINYQALPVLLLGPLFGLGALGGDAIESFFKRRRGVPSGHRWVPFDQMDYVLGAVLVSLPFVRLSGLQYLWIFIFWTLFHFAGNFAAWLIGLRKKPV